MDKKELTAAIEIVLQALREKNERDGLPANDMRFLVLFDDGSGHLENSEREATFWGSKDIAHELLS